ncbi:MAG: GAF domain-containing protein [Streptosporangiales bacterium]|nr:GAF domain-containing protein [Streptosporangiales bacterium]
MEPTPSSGVGQWSALDVLPQRLSGVIDLDVLSARAAVEVHRLLHDHLICVTWVDPSATAAGGDMEDPWLVVGAERGHREVDLTGLRIPPGAGIGGMVASTGGLVSVDDYTSETATRDFVGLMVDRERVGGAAGVPLCSDGRFVGLLFAGRRVDGALSDREIDVLFEVSRHLGALIGTARRAQEIIELARAEERQRIATALHDDVTQLLFAIGSSARRARKAMPDNRPDADRELERIESFASSAASAVRTALRAAVPVRPEQGLPLTLRTVIDSFTDRTQVPVEFVVLDRVPAQSPETTGVLAAVVREALANVAKHAPGAAVIVSLMGNECEVRLVVQDDGPGLPPGFELGSITAADAGEHFGLPNLCYRVGLLGGQLTIHDNEDGGATVCASIPSTPARA